MVKIFIDPGHGGRDPGATGNGVAEKDLTLNIALRLQSLLTNNYQNVSTRLSRSSDTTVSLRERTTMANDWRADYFVSIHVNAGGGEGFESYIWKGNYTNKNETEQLRTTLHHEIVNRMDWWDRGKKEANFHVLRQSSMPAVLTENGFIDNAREAREMRSQSWIREVAEAHAIGIAKAFRLTEKHKPAGTQFYRVVTGSFQTEANAKQRRYVLSKHGYSSFTVPFNQNGTLYYRVVTGSFNNKENAEKRRNQLKKIGFESFLVTYRP